MESTPDPQYDPERTAREAAEAAGAEQLDTQDEEHDPYAHLRPYQYKKGGPPGNPDGRPPGIRTLARRFRQAGALRPADVAAFQRLAQKLGIEAEALKGMDIMDLYTMTTMIHAMHGKGPAMAQIQQCMGTKLRYTPNDHKDKAATPQTYREDAIAFYEAVINSEDVTVAEKLSARRQLDVIQGLTTDNTTMGADQLGNVVRGFLAASETTIPVKETNASSPQDTGAENPPEAKVDRV